MLSDSFLGLGAYLCTLWSPLDSGGVYSSYSVSSAQCIMDTKHPSNPAPRTIKGKTVKSFLNIAQSRS